MKLFGIESRRNAIFNNIYVYFIKKKTTNFNFNLKKKEVFSINYYSEFIIKFKFRIFGDNIIYLSIII
jgi:hypothetical protein